MQSIRDQPSDIFDPQRFEHDLLDRRSGSANRLQSPEKRVRKSDLVISVGTNQKEVPHLRMRHQVLEDVERRCINSLQVVEEQRERVLLPCEYAEQAPEYHLEAV